MKKQPPIYLLDPSISWKTFKMLYDKLVRDSGPSPEHGDRMLWEMLKEKLIYCWFDPLPEHRGDMPLGLVLPKGRKIVIIKDKQK